jgi:hypothetical protein
MHDRADVASDGLAANFRRAEQAGRFLSGKTGAGARTVKRGVLETIMMRALHNQGRDP